MQGGITLLCVCVCVGGGGGGGGGGGYLTMCLVPSQERGEEGGDGIDDQDTEAAVECIHLVHTEITTDYGGLLEIIQTTLV